MSTSRLISPSIFNNKILDRNNQMGTAACEIMYAAINAVDPYQCVSSNLNLVGEILQIGDSEIDLDSFKSVFLIGFGKASVPMAMAVIDCLGDRINHAKVITKDKKFLSDNGCQGKLQVLLGGHPLPTKQSIESTKNLLNELPKLTKNDLALVVISGGGSALFTDPISTVSLEDLQITTQLLLNCGADIHEINTLRKHLDQVKGGGLALRLQPAIVQTLILSDVIGDRVDMIASGPTAADPSTFQDAMKIVKKYHLEDQIPTTVMTCLIDGVNGNIVETLKPENDVTHHVHHHLVGTNIKAASAANEKALALGFSSIIVSSQLTGLTSNVAEFITGIIQKVVAHGDPIAPPCCLIFGGETTVKVKGNGKGGRNQDLALRMVPQVANYPGVLFVSLATDGEDGPTDAAGAVVDSEVYLEGIQKKNLDINEYIKSNDAYHYFEALGGLIKTGSTGTNVNDIILIMFDQRAALLSNQS